MITITVHCPHCGSDALVRNGRAPNGKQKYLCRACQRQSREHPTPHASPEDRREEILRAYEERSSLRGLERTFEVSRNTVIAWIKKAAKLPALSETLIEPDATDAEATVLELDELWSFVVKKTNQAWIWIALCRKTRQVVAYAVGDRSQQTCRRLWEAIPAAYRTGHCYTDFWKAYQAVIRSASSTVLGERTPGKPLMSSAGIIRCGNGWLGLCAKRFLSRASLFMHNACLNLFLHRYNRERAIMLM